MLLIPKAALCIGTKALSGVGVVSEDKLAAIKLLSV